MRTIYVHRVVYLLTLFLTGVISLGQQSSEPHNLLSDTGFCCSKYRSHLWLQGHEVQSVQKDIGINYDVKFYKLDLEASNVNSQLNGYAEVSAETGPDPMNSFSIELSNKLTIDSAFINDIKFDYDHSLNTITISLDPPVEAETIFHFKLYYHTPPDYSSKYFSSTENPNYENFPVTQTFSEPFSAHEWMPCKQQLEDKADSVHVFITTDTSLMAAGPGLLTQVLLPDGKVRHEWRCHIPTAYYLIAFAVSDYQEYNLYAKPDSLAGDSILIQNMVFDLPGCLESNKSNIDKTPAMLELLSDLFTLYPFHKEKYGHYMWYPSGFSGMEHITMSGMRYFNTYLISHELGHSWFGNNVTCATWSDIWINEGFATYTQYLVLENLYSKVNADAQMQSYMNYVMQTPGGSVYVPPEDAHNAGRIFSTRYTYRKGGALVHMIRYLMQNDSLFFHTIQAFQTQFKDSTATGLDFKNVCESVTGIDFTDFFDQWYFGEGYPKYGLIWSQNEDTLQLQLSQSGSSPTTPLFTIPMEYLISYVGGDTLVRLHQSSNDTVYTILLPHEVTEIEIDPDNWVLNAVDTIIHRKNLAVKVFLEGPFNPSTQSMKTDLNPSLVPAIQPYGGAPWNYEGLELAAVLQDDAVDWVLVELHDTADISMISPGTMIGRQAGVLRSDGWITQTDGKNPLQFDHEILNGLFIRVIHRNHLDVLSATPLIFEKGVYVTDLTVAEEMVFSGTTGYKQLAPGTWGMASGDSNADGLINSADKSAYWNNSTGKPGYLEADFNLDGQTNNIDKDDLWLPNLGMNNNTQ